MAYDDWQRKCDQDERTTSDLVELCLAEPESEMGRDAIAIIGCRGGREEFEQGARLARSVTESERIAGADILAQLGWTRRTFLDESVAILIELLDDCTDAVISAAAIGLGHRGHPRAIEPLTNLVQHPNRDIREGVAHGLVPRQ